MKLFEKLKYISISTRISILLGIIILLTMGAFTTFSIIEQKNDAITSIRNNTDQLSQTIEKILRVSMLKNRRDEISLAINNIVANEGITSVVILNHKGLIKFSTRKSEINKEIPQSNHLCISCHNKEDENPKPNIKNFNSYRIDDKNNLIFNSLPIYNAPGCYNGVCHSTASLPEITNGNNSESSIAGFSAHDSSQTILGFIEIEVSIKKIISEIEKTRAQLLFLTVLFALIASIITYFSIRYLIGKPVKNLVDGTLRVAQGDFKHEIPPGKAELRLLSESFNKMQKQLITTQSQLIESEKLASVGKLADEIANEINNPLTGIIVYSESLLEDPNMTVNKADLQIIRQEGLKIRESIRNILSLTKQEKPDFGDVSISNIIKQAISVVEKFSNFRNIQIITKISNSIPKISADASLMEQVFLNLLLISSESMQKGGIVNISTSYVDDNKEIDIVFADTGKGIPEKVVQKIFDPAQVYSLDNYEKIGISLTVCKDIIEMHNGRISINSSGNGTSVIIKLPL
jgi:two-component system, NtrC family, sensor kinase